MSKKKILVVLGGKSKERAISIATGNACIKALKKLKYNVLSFDPAKKPYFSIDRKKTDIIFNALHGKEGEDGKAQSYFEYLNIPYTHSGVLSSMNCMDKIVSKEIFKKNKILTPIHVNFNSYSFKKINFRTLLKKKKIDFPVVIKPSDEGSSIGVQICKNFNKLKRSIKSLSKIYNNLMIEKYIGGQEVQVGVMNGKAMGAIELKPKRNFYDYRAKYLKSAKTLHIMPANISKKQYKKVMKISEKAHKAMKCRGVTRCDFKFFKNKFYLLEINTQPGMTDLSLVPEIAKYEGISFKSLVKKIINDAGINK